MDKRGVGDRGFWLGCKFFGIGLKLGLIGFVTMSHP